jgi:hypothetical protein
MYTLDLSTDISSSVSDVWRTWSDLESYPRWDPREQELRLESAFADGATGYSKQKGNRGGPFTLVDVDFEKGWTTVCPLPGGELRIEHRLVPADTAGATRISKTYLVSGPLGVVFRLYYGSRIRAAQPASFAALAAEVMARSSR